MQAPELITEDFTLRALRIQDAPALVELNTNPETQYFTTVPVPYSETDALWFIDYAQRAAAKGQEFVWAIDYSGAYAGTIALRLPEASAESPGSTGSLGYASHPDFRRQGIMKRAVAMVLGFGFDPQGLGLDSITWSALADNEASIALARSVGFRDFWVTEQSAEERVLPDGQVVTRNEIHARMSRADFAAIWV
ncbi:MAG: GNAT family N-acetyltransferase [Rothia sp. (in: high G+C Gram-positive bacteria)]|uniref:GNAT family N-acetyltransferase n=1 Tax=Rothia sp. (in: high G+C Gram-positive bacteria) TaxID=1885016 RepID=UPI0026DEC14E|nr:GNAT family N-acetyltransferase [Rothia sp. (in: high G+C Gram-positive bacteria)]MDO5750473.1 GNAT family N-acetyltransferase [Rothia sp. (in: high G+C Gram-positive bacteria)]